MPYNTLIEWINSSPRVSCKSCRVSYTCRRNAKVKIHFYNFYFPRKIFHPERKRRILEANFSRIQEFPWLLSRFGINHPKTNQVLYLCVCTWHSYSFWDQCRVKVIITSMRINVPRHVTHNRPLSLFFICSWSLSIDHEGTGLIATTRLNLLNPFRSGVTFITLVFYIHLL